MEDVNVKTSPLEMLTRIGSDTSESSTHASFLMTLEVDTALATQKRLALDQYNYSKQIKGATFAAIRADP